MEHLFNILIPLIFSAFFSGMEMAYLSSNKLRYELDKKNANLTNRILDFFFQNPNQFISTLLVGNCIALVVYGVQIVPLIAPLFQPIFEYPIIAFLAQSIFATFIVLFAGDFIDDKGDGSVSRDIACCPETIHCNIECNH